MHDDYKTMHTDTIWTRPFSSMASVPHWMCGCGCFSFVCYETLHTDLIYTFRHTHRPKCFDRMCVSPDTHAHWHAQPKTSCVTISFINYRKFSNKFKQLHIQIYYQNFANHQQLYPVHAHLHSLRKLRLQILICKWLVFAFAAIIVVIVVANAAAVSAAVVVVVITVFAFVSTNSF